MVVHDADLVVRADGAALGLDDGLGIVIDARVVDQPFGHAEDLLQRGAQRGRDASRHFRNQLGATHLDELQAGEIRRAAGSSFQPQQQQRWHQGGVGHLLGGDQLEAHGRCGGRGQHHAPAHVERAEKARRAHREVVCHGQRAQVDACLVHPADACALAQRVDVVIVRARDELREPGAAARDLEEGRVLALHVGGRERVSGMGGRRRVGTHQLGQRGEAAGVAPGDDDVLDLRAARLQLGGQVAIVEAAPVPGADVAAGIARVGKVRDLGDAVRRQRIQRDDAHAEHGEDGADEFRQVGQVDDDPITAAEPAGQQTGRDGGCLAVQVAIADALAFTHHGDAVGVGLGPFAQPRAEGLAPPVAGLAVAAGQVLGPRLM